MKRISTIIVLIFLVTAFQAQAKEKLMSLQIRKGSLRSTPTFFGSVKATVNYGDRLSVIETKGDWSNVSPVEGKKSGWIHNSALTKKKIKLKASDDQTDVAASSGELALAGKGFNSDVEAQFKAKNKDIDFSWIDKMEKIKISHTKMKQFLDTGKVVAKDGAK